MSTSVSDSLSGSYVYFLDDASLEISGNGRSGDEVLDTVRDVVAQLGLPLHALSTRHASLDEVFLRTAGSGDR